MNDHWLFKPPRAKPFCHFCGTTRLGLGVCTPTNNNRGTIERLTFCGPNCEASYINCLYERTDARVSFFRALIGLY